MFGLSLPPAAHPLRDALDLAHLAEVADPANRGRLVSFVEAKANAVRDMRTNPAIRSINSLVIRANGDLELLRIGPRGGTKTLWNFGRL